MPEYGEEKKKAPSFCFAAEITMKHAYLLVCCSFWKSEIKHLSDGSLWFCCITEQLGLPRTFRETIHKNKEERFIICFSN